MAFRTQISVLVLTLVVTVLALPIGASEITSQKFPYLGQVTGTDIYVRSGYGETDGQSNFYPCTKVSQPANVKVIAERNGWLQIEPVAGCFSVISKRFVKLDTAGKTGVVTADDVRVRAGGKMRESNFLAEHQRLDDGQKVIVLGEVTDKFGDWYKIAPPEGAYYWIYGDFVAQIAGDESQDQEESTEPATSDETKTASDPSDDKAAEEPADSTAPAAPASPLLTQIQKLEQQLLAEYEKPLTLRDYPSVLSAYKSLQIPADSYLKPRVLARIKSLEKAIGQRAEMDQIQGIIADTLAQRKQMEMSRTRSQVELQVEPGQRKYTAQGVLAASAVFSGSAATPKRYIIRQPGTRKIIAYVQSPDGKVDMDSYVGMTVGIHGPAKFSPSIALNLIDAISVVVLDEKIQSLGLPKPVIKMPVAQQDKPAEAVTQEAETEDAEAEDAEAEETDSDETTEASDEDESDTGLEMVEDDEDSSTKEIDESQYE